jgi:hypothetical protein
VGIKLQDGKFQAHWIGKFYESKFDAREEALMVISKLQDIRSRMHHLAMINYHFVGINEMVH